MSKFAFDQKELLELIPLTAEKLSLPHPIVVDKDIYVTKVVSVLSEIENEHFDLVFKGGSCLAKTGITKRMSEDCDYCINLKGDINFNSNSTKRKELRNLRKQILEQLHINDFHIDEKDVKVRNEGAYIEIKARYNSAYESVTTIKPYILLEFFCGQLKLPYKKRKITSLIKQVYGEKINHSTFDALCISPLETAAEKWVGLTRRIATIKHREYYRDNNIVRHLYDFYKIDKHGFINDKFVDLAVNIIDGDKNQFKNHNKDFTKDPSIEIKAAFIELISNPEWKKHWKSFIETMVFDTDIPEYDYAIELMKQKQEEICSKFY